MASFSESSAASPGTDCRSGDGATPAREATVTSPRGRFEISIGILDRMDASSRSVSLYYRLPASMQNLVLYGAGLRQARVRFGRAFEKRLESLRDSDLWDGSRIRD